jgi:hypothetical protein
MEFNLNQGVEAYRQGQYHGAIAGVIASAAAYYLFKAYRPANPWKTNKDRHDHVS